MTTPMPAGEFDALERKLLFLASDVVFPRTPAFAMPTAQATPPPMRRVPDKLTSSWWKAGLAAATLLIVTTLAVPDANQAVADWFGFPGIRIEVGDRDDDPPATVTTIGGSLFLGQSSTLDSAQERTGMSLTMPVGDGFGIEPEVYLNNANDSQIVNLLYPASEALPAIGATGVGLLLTQIDASPDTSSLFVKRAADMTSPQPVSVGGVQGLWIQGGVLLTEAGDPFGIVERRSGNVLIWEQGGVTYRMESNVTLERAVAIAESLEPVGE